MSIDPIEFFWIITNTIAIIITVTSFLESRQDLIAAKDTDGQFSPARVLTALGKMRREGFRIIISTLLLILIVPGLFSDRPVTLTPFVAIFITIPMILLISTILDRRERWQLDQLLLEMNGKEK